MNLKATVSYKLLQKITNMWIWRVVILKEGSPYAVDLKSTIDKIKGKTNNN